MFCLRGRLGVECLTCSTFIVVGEFCVLRLREFRRHRQVRFNAEQAKKKKKSSLHQPRIRAGSFAVCSQNLRKLLSRIRKPRGYEPSVPQRNADCPSGSVLSTGAFPVAEFCPTEGRRERGGEAAPPSKFPGRGSGPH